MAGWLTFKLMEKIKYPKLNDIQRMLQATIPEVETIMQDAFIVGSQARGTATPESDVDVAILVKESDLAGLLEELDMLDLDYLNTELLNARADTDVCTWEGRPVDLQVFVDSDPRLKDYSKIKLKASSQARLG